MEYHDWKINNKISKAKYILSKFKNNITLEGRKLIYNSFVESHLWGNSNGNSLRKLRTKQKAIVRTIVKGKYHTEPIMRKNKIVSQKDLYAIEMTKTAWEYHFNRLPKGVTDTIKPRNQVHELRN